MDDRTILTHFFKFDIRKAKGAKEGLIGLCKRIRGMKNLPKVRMVEVGSFSGVSAYIFASMGVGKLYCVDPWESNYDPNDLSSNPQVYDMKEVEAEFDKVRNLYPSKIEKMKMTSLEAASKFGDGSLDAVYIDGNHQESAVRKDINAWLPKVKKGGIIAGHDYGNKHHPHVKKVVDSIFGIPDKVFSDTSWMVRLREGRLDWTDADIGAALDPRFASLVRDKRVIFVGPSPILKGRGLGEWIDSHDVVVRTNGAIHHLFDSEYTVDYGSKCDILYINGQFLRDGKLNVEWCANVAKVKAIVFKSCNQDMLKEYGKHVIARRLGKIKRDVAEKLPSALLGVFLIEDLNQYEPSEVFVTGIDFYHSRGSHRFVKGDFSEYFSPTYLPKSVQDHRNNNLSGKKDGHDPIKNTQYMLELYEGGKWKTHDFIEELMKKVASGG